MIQFLLISIFISAALSLISYVYCWHDIKAGRPHIISLRQIMSVMDRDRLNQWFGAPQPGYYYPLSPELTRQITRGRAWFFYSECLVDIICLLGAWRFSTGLGDPILLYPFIIMAGICQAINLIYSLWLMQKWKHQIREEIENSED